MKYYNKLICIFFSIVFLMLVTFMLCNHSNANYKTRITVDTVNVEIIPNQPNNITTEEQ